MKHAAMMLAVLLAFSLSAPAADDLRGPVAITNVTVVPQPGQKIEQGTVLIRNGRIEAVGAAVDLPPGTRIIDGKGGVAYAGFVDGFSRVGVTEPDYDADDERRIESDIPSVSDGPHVNMQQANRHGIFARRQVEDLLDIEDDTFERHRQGGFTTALLVPPRALLGGSGSVLDLGSGPLRTGILSTDTLQTGSFSPPSGRGIRNRGNYPGTLLGSVAHIRQTLLDAGWYGEMLAHAERSPNAEVPFDPDLSRLLAVRQGKQTLAWEASSEDQIRRSLQLLGEFKLNPIIVGGQRAWEAADALKANKASVLISLNLPKEPREYKFNGNKLSADITDGTTLGKNWGQRPFQPQAAFEEAQRDRTAVLSNPQQLNEAGILWAFTTDGSKNVKDNLDQVRHLIDAGLSHDDALRGLTTNAADILGLRDEIGTLEPGKRGSVTLLSAPLGDKDARVTHVVVAGDVFVIDGSTKTDKDTDKKRGDKKGKGKDKGGDEDESEADKEEDTDDKPVAKRDPLRAHEPGWAIETDADRGSEWKTGGSVLLENAHVLTITGGDLEKTSILVKDGKIARIGKNLAPGANVKRVDLSGYVVMPGMIDPHAHTSIAAVNEWTMSVTAEVRIADVITHDDPVMYWALTGGVTTMHTMHGSANAIGGQNMILKNRYGQSIENLPYDPDKRTIKFALGENVKRQGLARGRFDQSSPRRFPGTRMGVEAVMRRALAAGDVYRKERAEHAKASRSGKKVAPFRRDLRLEALADVLDGKLWVNCHCYRSDEILRLLRVAEDFGFRIAALHHVLEGYRVMPEILRHGCGTATFADWWAYKIEAYDAVPHNAGMMLKYGVNSTIKSDSDDLIRHMNVEAAKCMKFSQLSPNDALKMVTINAAKLFGMDDRIGSIEVGKDADLAVFSGHPLDTFSRCVMTLVDGEAYFVHRDFDPANPRQALPIKVFADQSKPAGKPGTVNTRSDKPISGSGTFAITNATLHPVSSAAIEGGTLVIRDGKIAALGKDVSVPSGATVIDARGQHVYPGLINAGTNLGLYEIGAVNVTVDSSGPGTFQPDLMAVSALNPHSVMFEVARAEGITTALVVANGPTIAGQAGSVHLDGWSMPEMLIDSKVGLVINLPGGRSEPIVPRQRERNRDEGGDPLAEIDRFFKDAALYNAAPQDFEYDARHAAMDPYLKGDKPVLFRAVSYRQILEALQFAERHQLRPIIFGGRDAWRVADLLAERKVPVIYEGTFAMPSRVPGLGNVSDVWDAHYRGLAVLAEAGVQFAVSRRDADLAKLAATEIGFAVAHGLDPERAVQAMTLDAARILGLGDSLGSLEVGKVANVIVCSDHPAQVSNEIEHVFIRGKHVPTASKHSRMAEKFAGRPKPELPDRRNDLAGPPSQSNR